MSKIFFEGKSQEDFMEEIVFKIKDLIENRESDVNISSGPNLLSRKKTAKILDVSYGTLNNWNRENILKPVQLGGRVYYRPSDIENAIQEIK